MSLRAAIGAAPGPCACPVAGSTTSSGIASQESTRPSQPAATLASLRVLGMHCMRARRVAVWSGCKLGDRKVRQDAAVYSQRRCSTVCS
jgi:hypothetical protein